MLFDLRPSFFALAIVSFIFLQSVDTSAREIRGKPIVKRSKTNAAPTNPAPVRTEIPTPVKNGEYLTVSFDTLAGYTFEVPEGVQPTNSVKTERAGPIPADVQAFDQKKVSLTGFMLPLKVDDGVVTEMLIMKDQSMCCYGAVPRINDWVSVKMKNGGVKSVMDQEVTLFGKLKVGEMLENGYLVGIYEMEGDKMVEND